VWVWNCSSLEEEERRRRRRRRRRRIKAREARYRDWVCNMFDTS
jgi:hypothetical protein